MCEVCFHVCLSVGLSTPAFALIMYTNMCLYATITTSIVEGINIYDPAWNWTYDPAWNWTKT